MNIDAQLVEGAKKGDGESFSRLYELVQDDLYKYALYALGNAHDAEDQTEDAFVYCYRRYADYDPGKSALSTWLYLVVNSRIKNYYRDRKEAVDLEELAPVLADDAPEIEDVVYLQQLRDMLDESGLSCACTHIGFGEMEEDIDRVIREHKLLGCEYPGIGGLPVEDVAWAFDLYNNAVEKGIGTPLNLWDTPTLS